MSNCHYKATDFHQKCVVHKYDFFKYFFFKVVEFCQKITTLTAFQDFKEVNVAVAYSTKLENWKRIVEKKSFVFS